MHWAIATSVETQRKRAGSPLPLGVLPGPAAASDFTQRTQQPADQFVQQDEGPTTAPMVAGDTHSAPPPDAQQQEDSPTPSANGPQNTASPTSAEPAEVAELQRQLVSLQTQVAELTQRNQLLETQLREEPVGVAPRYPQDGKISHADWDKLHLKLSKADRALNQERSHVELLRTQLEQQRESAAVGAQASQTIQGLERELASCRALFEQRTREAEGLQRTVRLSDEMAARYKAQLDGLLKANQTAVAREQELEHQVRDLQARLAQQQQQQQPSQDSHAAMQAAHQALQARVADLESENRQLKQRSTEMGEALNAARAECARKEAGIKALESVLTHHNRQPPTPSHTHNHTHEPPTPHTTTTTAAATAAVAIHIHSEGAACEPPLAGTTLTESQWKLVVLVDEVRSLRASITQLRQGSTGTAGLTGHEPPGSVGSAIQQESEEREILEIDLPIEQVRARVEVLAKQRLELEEELEALRQQYGISSHVQGNGGGEAQHTVKVMGQGPKGQGQGLSGAESRVVATQAQRRRTRRRGWLSWLFGGREGDMV